MLGYVKLRYVIHTAPPGHRRRSLCYVTQHNVMLYTQPLLGCVTLGYGTLYYTHNNPYYAASDLMLTVPPLIVQQGAPGSSDSLTGGPRVL